MAASGAEVKQKITKSFPSFERWSKFLQTAPPDCYSFPDFNPFNPDLPTYYISEGVRNNFKFHNADFGNSNDWQPFSISQKYSNKKLNYEIKTGILKNKLFAQLELKPKSKMVDHLTIRSSYQVFESSNFLASQSIVIELKKECKNKLKRSGIIPRNADNIIVISDFNGVRSIKIETNNRNNTKELSSDTLKQIGDEIQFDFYMKDNQTSGWLGDLSFTVKHVNPLSLDADSVWDSLTGKEGKPFIFPVEVTKIDQK